MRQTYLYVLLSLVSRRTCYAFATHLLRTWCALATHLLRTCYALATHLLRICYAFATHLLRTCYAFATHLLRTCYALATHKHQTYMRDLLRTCVRRTSDALLRLLRTCIRRICFAFPRIKMLLTIPYRHMNPSSICSIGRNHKYIHGVYTVFLAGKSATYGHVRFICTILKAISYVRS